MKIDVVSIQNLITDGASCDLLVLDQNIHILINCGLPRSLNFKIYENYENQLKNIDVILFTHSGVEYMGGLPFLLSQYKLNNVHILLTPPLKLSGVLNIYFDSILSAILTHPSPRSFNRIDLLKKIHYFVDEGIELKYHQKQFLSIRHYQLEFTPYRVGHAIGSCLWYIQYQNINLMSMLSYNNYQELHLDSIDIESVKRNCLQIDLLLTDSNHNQRKFILSSQDERNKLMTKICEQLEQAIRYQTKVVISVYPNERIFEILMILDSIWKKFKQTFQDARVHLIHPYRCLIERLKSHADFLSKDCQDVINDSSELDNLNFQNFLSNSQQLNPEEPIILSTFPTLFSGPLNPYFRKFLTDPQNCVIFFGQPQSEIEAKETEMELEGITGSLMKEKLIKQIFGQGFSELIPNQRLEEIQNILMTKQEREQKGQMPYHNQNRPLLNPYQNYYQPPNHHPSMPSNMYRPPMGHPIGTPMGMRVANPNMNMNVHPGMNMPPVPPQPYNHNPQMPPQSGYQNYNPNPSNQQQNFPQQGYPNFVNPDPFQSDYDGASEQSQTYDNTEMKLQDLNQNNNNSNQQSSRAQILFAQKGFPRFQLQENKHQFNIYGESLSNEMQGYFQKRQNLLKRDSEMNDQPMNRAELSLKFAQKCIQDTIQQLDDIRIDIRIEPINIATIKADIVQANLIGLSDIHSSINIISILNPKQIILVNGQPDEMQNMKDKIIHKLRKLPENVHETSDQNQEVNLRLETNFLEISNFEYIDMKSQNSASLVSGDLFAAKDISNLKSEVELSLSIKNVFNFDEQNLFLRQSNYSICSIQDLCFFLMEKSQSENWQMEFQMDLGKIILEQKVFIVVNDNSFQIEGALCQTFFQARELIKQYLQSGKSSSQMNIDLSN